MSKLYLYGEQVDSNERMKQKQLTFTANSCPPCRAVTTVSSVIIGMIVQTMLVAVFCERFVYAPEARLAHPASSPSTAASAT